MEVFFGLIALSIPAGMLFRWLFVRSRFKELEERLRHLELSGGSRAASEIAELEAQVRRLEKRLDAFEKPVPEAAREAVPEPVSIAEPTPIPARVAESVCQWCGYRVPADSAFCTHCGSTLRPVPFEEEAREAIPAPNRAPLRAPEPALVPAAVETLASRVREGFSHQEWEAVVGGNWLNKLGALVLVVGIALFLGYSFTQMGPAGRAGTGLAVSLALLAAGVWTERKPDYTVFARGLIGAGWAALYSTVFAMHAVDATRVIENPIAGSALLLAVAGGMVAHSLRYRVESITGLAFFTAFAALAISPSTPFAAAALAPIAAALLYLARRFSWYGMALFGFFATYGTIIYRGDAGASLAGTQTILFVYWALFEGFDLLRVSCREDRATATWIAPLNAVAFLFLSFQKWQKVAPEDVHILAAGASALFLASAILRAYLRPASSFAASASHEDRLAGGSYELSLTVSALLAGLAIFHRVPGIWASAGVALEAEILFLAGLRFGAPYIQFLGTAGFGFSLGRLIFHDLPRNGQTTVFGHAFYDWSPVALLHAAAFFANRAIRKPAVYFSYAASALLALVIGFEFRERFVGLAWIALGFALLEIGLRKKLDDFRFQGYGALLLGAAGVCYTHGTPLYRPGWEYVAIAAILGYALALRAVRLAGSIATAFFAVLCLSKLYPNDYFGLATLALAALLLELGLRRLPTEMRRVSYATAVVGAAGVFLMHLDDFHKFAGRPVWLSYAGAALIAYAFAARVYRAAIAEKERADVSAAATFAGTAFALTALWISLPDALVAVGWALLALLLIETGFATAILSLRWLGNACSALAFARLFVSNFTNNGETAHISHRLLTVVPLLLLHVHLWQRGREESASLAAWERSAMRLHLWAAAIMAFVLFRFEFGRVYAVVGWALLVLALLWTGLRRQLADLRWQSYLIAILTFLRSWTTNFYVPGSLGGLPSRLTTATCVVAAFYAAQLLSPRAVPAAGGNWLDGTDRHARVFFCLLATILLTALLYHEVSGSMLTVSWGIEGVVLLICGFPLRERALRLSGLVLLLGCILKLFFYDLRNLETMPRILSFIALGAILMAVSFIYTRFRERIRQLL